MHTTKYRDSCRELWENYWTDWDAVSDAESGGGGSKEHVLHGV